MTRQRDRTLSIRLDDGELASLHALARAEDEPIGRMLRRWVKERYTARFGATTPPATVTKFGDAVKPSIGGDR